MNSKLIAATVIALSSFGATAAFADTFEVITPNTTSNTTREAVMAESAKARVPVAGSADTSRQIRWNTNTNTTRAAVMSELAKAKADGSLEVANNIGEFNTASGRPVTSQTLAKSGK